MFGGQVCGLRLLHAEPSEERLGTIPFHSYFLRPGDSKKPIIYDVETLRDGNSFSACLVAAYSKRQTDFLVPRLFPGGTRSGRFEHQKTMPSAPAPDGLPSETQIAQSPTCCRQRRLKIICDCPLEVRPVEFHNPLKVTSQNHIVRRGFRANGSVPDDLRVHQYRRLRF